MKNSIITREETLTDIVKLLLQQNDDLRTQLQWATAGIVVAGVMTYCLGAYVTWKTIKAIVAEATKVIEE